VERPAFPRGSSTAASAPAAAPSEAASAGGSALASIAARVCTACARCQYVLVFGDIAAACEYSQIRFGHMPAALGPARANVKLGRARTLRRQHPATASPTIKTRIRTVI